MRALLAALALIFGILAFAGLPCSAQGISTLLATVRGETITVYLYMPDLARGRAPLVILSHGSPRDPLARERYGADTLSRQANALASLGLAVAVPIRRGYGGHGTWAEGYGSCETPAYHAAGQAGADDIAAAIDVVGTRPGIDRSRIVLIGHSAGGWASIAAASRLAVRGVISFAGGRGSQHPHEVCNAKALVAAVQGFATERRTPQLWIYSRNDQFFDPSLAKRLHAAFTDAGGEATLLLVAAHGGDGHGYIDDVRSWMPEVKRFLKSVDVLH